MATPKLVFTAEGIPTGKEDWALAEGAGAAGEKWLDEITRPHREERERHREIQEYICKLRELSERREAEIAAVQEHACRIDEYLKERVEERAREKEIAEQATAEVEKQFRVLAEQWYIETMPLSSYFEKILHPAYQKLLTLGEAAVPFILRELEDEPNDWFWALRIITDADPVTAEQAGDMEAMAEAWLRWGRENGYI
ncbi:MAG: hypothetical protein QOC99_179 [Acidobacteriota bacterium]|nr:hypothetical protein [Acidobacteriota bacterium]